MSIVWVNKPIGWTPKMCVDKYRNNDKDKIAFAGRLDPMAYGLLPLIINGNQKLCDEVVSNYKTYRFKLILGIQTDTYDILGLINNYQEKTIYTVTELGEILDEHSKMKNQEYPPYSSKMILNEKTGKKTALWELTKNGIEVVLPTHDVDIEYIKLLSSDIISIDNLHKIIAHRINELPLNVDMRQADILELWGNFISENKDHVFQIIKCEASVSSGTYIRSIGNSMGGTCFDINRIKYGDKIISIKNNKYQYMIH